MVIDEGLRSGAREDRLAETSESIGLRGVENENPIRRRDPGALLVGRLPGDHGGETAPIGPEQLLRHRMGEEERRVAIQTEGCPIGGHAAAAYPLLIEHGRQLVERGVLFEDLTQLFAGVEEPVYIDRCCHLNTLGKRYLIRAIAAKIRQDLEQQRRISKDE